jgi:hypothetical protein
MPNLDITYCQDPGRTECMVCERNPGLHDFGDNQRWVSPFCDLNEVKCTHMLEIKGKVKS